MNTEVMLLPYKAKYAYRLVWRCAAVGVWLSMSIFLCLRIDAITGPSSRGDQVPAAQCSASYSRGFRELERRHGHVG